MSTAENEIDEKKKNGASGDEPHDLADDDKPAKKPAKAAAREEAEDEDLDEDDEDESEEEDDDEPPPSSRKSKAKVKAKAPVRAVKRASTNSMTGASSLRNIWTIARREMRSYFDSLIAYVVIGGTLLWLGLYFFLFQSGGFWEVDRASMARLFQGFTGTPNWPSIIGGLVIPLVTMRSLAEEKGTGTLELLITMPVRDSDVILGKYIAAMGMCTALLASSLLYPIMIFVWPWHMGALDWGPVWTGYLGLWLYCAAGCGLGILFSGITDNQIIAYFLTAGVLEFLHFIGDIAESVSGVTGDVISFVSFQSRFQPFERGLIDTRAVVYFVSIAVLCLLVAFRSLESRKWK